MKDLDMRRETKAPGSRVHLVRTSPYSWCSKLLTGVTVSTDAREVTDFCQGCVDELAKDLAA